MMTLLFVCIFLSVESSGLSKGDLLLIQEIMKCSLNLLCFLLAVFVYNSHCVLNKITDDRLI